MTPHRHLDAPWWRSLCLLRQDGRRSLTAVSRVTHLSITTLFERLQRWPGLRRHTMLLNFAALGAQSVWLIVERVPRERRDDLEAFLVRHPAVNTVQRVATDADFLVEIVVPEARAAEAFVDAVHLHFGVGDATWSRVLLVQWLLCP